MTDPPSAPRPQADNLELGTWNVELARVGLGQPAGSFDALADPAATDALAAALAERLRPAGPDLVVVWEGLNSVVLGYAVGLHLGRPVIVLSDDEGLVTTATPPRRGSRAALVAPLTPDTALVRMAVGYLESQRIALVGTAVLLARTDADQETIALAMLPPEEERPEILPRQDDGQTGRLDQTRQTGGEHHVR